MCGVRCSVLLMPSVFLFLFLLGWSKTPLFGTFFAAFLPSPPSPRRPSYRVLPSLSHRTVVDCHIGGAWAALPAGRWHGQGEFRKRVGVNDVALSKARGCSIFGWFCSHPSVPPLWVAGSGSSGTLVACMSDGIGYHQGCTLIRPPDGTALGEWPCRVASCSVFLSFIPLFLSPLYSLRRHLEEAWTWAGLGVCLPFPRVRFQLTQCFVPVMVTPHAGRLAGAVGRACLLLIGIWDVVSHIVSDGSVLTLWRSSATWSIVRH